MLFRERLKAARKKAGLTQAQLAAQIGINRATLARYESGQINPPYEQIEKIIKALNVPFFAFFPIEQNPGLIVQELEAVVVDIDSLFFVIRGLLTYDNLTEEDIAKLLEDIPDMESIADRLNRLIALARAVDSGDEILAGLNDLGKEEALKRIEELTLIPKYRQTAPEDA